MKCLTTNCEAPAEVRTEVYHGFCGNCHSYLFRNGKQPCAKCGFPSDLLNEFDLCPHCEHDGDQPCS